MLGLPEGKYLVGKTQHNIAVFLILLWFPLVIIPGYVPDLLGIPLIKANSMWFTIGTDLMFIIAFFGL